jgi:hypothetical protein
MAQSANYNLKNWDYGQRRADFPEDSFGRTIPGTTPAAATGGGGATGGGNTSTSGNFFLETLTKNDDLMAAFKNAMAAFSGNSTANTSALDQFTKAMQTIAKQNQATTGQQMGAANAPFDGTLAANLGKTRSDWATAAGSAADQTKNDLTSALNEWNTGQVGRIGSLADQLKAQLGKTGQDIGNQIGLGYRNELAANQRYNSAADIALQRQLNNASNDLFSRTSPLTGSAGSGLTDRLNRRIRTEASEKRAEQIAGLDRESELRQQLARLGLLESQGNIGMAQTRDIGGLGLNQGNDYYRAVAANQAANAARQQQIIDQMMQGQISDIGYVGGQQQAWRGWGQNQANADAANLLAPIQARQANAAFNTSQLGYLANNVLPGVQYMSVGTNGNQGGSPRYSTPPSVPNYGSPVPYGYDNFGYAPQQAGNPNNFQMTTRQVPGAMQAPAVNGFDQWFQNGGMNGVYNPAFMNEPAPQPMDYPPMDTYYDPNTNTSNYDMTGGFGYY